MRELKFRIGVKSSSGFRYLDKGELINLYRLIPWDGALVAKDHGRNVIVPKEAYIIEQYTGLKDKNGKEIYEGDIVEYGLIGGPERGYVAYADEYAAYEVYSNRDFIFGGLFGRASDVIGNIHENPELLEEGAR